MIGLSKFCELRPKWCVTVLSSGTHSVCVCNQYQNTKLLVDSFCSAVKPKLKRKAEESENKNVPKFDIIYKDLMAMVLFRYHKISNAWCIVARTVLGTLLWRTGTNLQN